MWNNVGSTSNVLHVEKCVHVYYYLISLMHQSSISLQVFLIDILVDMLVTSLARKTG